MKQFILQLRGAILSTLMLAVVCCGAYPVLVYSIGQALFPAKANGSIIVDSKGVTRGSTLIGQNFTAARYFHSRPSAAGNGYDAVNSGGSNLGPTSQKLRDSIAQNIARYRSENGLATNAPVPADAVTSSGSGLDQHISVENALLQAPRVAKERGMALEKVEALITQHTQGPDWGFLGEPGVNVLMLNLALDGMK